MRGQIYFLGVDPSESKLTMPSLPRPRTYVTTVGSVRCAKSPVLSHIQARLSGKDGIATGGRVVTQGAYWGRTVTCELGRLFKFAHLRRGRHGDCITWRSITKITASLLAEPKRRAPSFYSAVTPDLSSKIREERTEWWNGAVGSGRAGALLDEGERRRKTMDFIY